MTFLQVYTEVMRIRFTGQTANAKTYVNAAEVALWNAADWDFKRVPATTLSVAAGVATEPSDFGKAIRLYDPRGWPVDYQRPDPFEEDWIAPVPAPTGNAQAFTVIDRQILVGPPETGTFKLSYRRRYTKRNSGGSPTQGVMSADLDTPYWDTEHHYILVPWAIQIGEVLEQGNDPGRLDALISSLKEGSLFQAMRDELVGGVEHQVAVWGQDC